MYSQDQPPDHLPFEKLTRKIRTGWEAQLARISLAVLLFETVSGLAITLSRFHPAIEWGLLVHTALGLATLLPVAWYYSLHWDDYRKQALSDVILLGYIALLSLAVCSVSGVVVTFEGLLGIRTASLWRHVHLYSTLAALLTSAPHLTLAFLRKRKTDTARPAGAAMIHAGAVTAALIVLVGKSVV